MENWIPWAISGVSLLFVIMTYVRNGNKDMVKETREEDTAMNSVKESLLKANMKLDQVCSTTNETRTDIKSLNKDLQNLDIRMAIVEKDLKNAFHQIDELTHRVSDN